MSAPAGPSPATAWRPPPGAPPPDGPRRRGTGRTAALLALALVALAVGLTVWLGRVGPDPGTVEGATRVDVEAVGPPVLADGVIVVPIATGFVGIDRTTLEPRWEVGGCPFSGWPEHDPAVVGGRVLASCDGRYRALDVTAPELLWDVPREGIPGIVRLSTDAAVITYDGRLDVRDAATGALRWQRALPPGPVAVELDGATVFVGDGPTLRALDAGTGAERWTTPVAVASLRSGPGGLFGRTADHRMVALDPRTGVPRWTTPPDPDRLTWGGVLGTTTDTVVVQARGGNVAAYDATTGAMRWTFNDDDRLGLDLSAGDDRVAITTDEPSLLVLDAGTGQVVREEPGLDVLIRADLDAHTLVYTASLGPGAYSRRLFVEPAP